MDRHDKGSVNVMQIDGPFKWDGTQHTIEEELRIFQNTTGIL